MGRSIMSPWVTDVSGAIERSAWPITKHGRVWSRDLEPKIMDAGSA